MGAVKPVLGHSSIFMPVISADQIRGFRSGRAKKPCAVLCKKGGNLLQRIRSKAKQQKPIYLRTSLQISNTYGSARL